MNPAGDENNAMPDPPGGSAVPPAPPTEPVFQVRVCKHTGAVLFWFNQRTTVTGTYAQCEAAISAANQHNLLFGWWSVGSLLWNPIAMSVNSTARRVLRQQAGHAYHYAQWWATQQGAGSYRTPSWAPPPTPPKRRKWWLIPVGIVGSIAVLFVALVAFGAIHSAIHRHSEDSANGSAPSADSYGYTAKPFALVKVGDCMMGIDIHDPDSNTHGVLAARCPNSTAPYELAAVGPLSKGCPDGRSEQSSYATVQERQAKTLTHPDEPALIYCFALNLIRDTCYGPGPYGYLHDIDCTTRKEGAFKVVSQVDGNPAAECAPGEARYEFPLPVRVICVTKLPEAPQPSR